jgi:hypothetical protein
MFHEDKNKSFWSVEKMAKFEEKEGSFLGCPFFQLSEEPLLRFRYEVKIEQAILQIYDPHRLSKDESS